MHISSAIVDVSPLKERSGPCRDDLLLFWADRYTFLYEPRPTEGDPELEWIVSENGVPWLELDIDIPLHEEMVAEAVECRDLFVSHRKGDGWDGQGSTLRSFDPKSTRSLGNYGYASDTEAPYVWTELAERCSVTAAFLKDFLSFRKLNRVRFMLLELMGCVLPHIDTWNQSLSSTHSCVNLSDTPGYTSLRIAKSRCQNSAASYGDHL